MGAAERSTNEPPTKPASARVQSAPTHLDAPFTAEMILSLDRGKAIEQFQKTGTVPPSDDQITTDDRLQALYIISGCMADAQGKCNVSARSVIVRSNGSYYAVAASSADGGGSSAIFPVRVGKRVPQFDKNTTYALGTLDFSLLRLQDNFDPQKISGEYLFLTTFTDNNSGDEIALWKVAHVSAGRAAQ